MGHLHAVPLPVALCGKASVYTIAIMSSEAKGATIMSLLYNVGSDRLSQVASFSSTHVASCHKRIFLDFQLCSVFGSSNNHLSHSTTHLLVWISDLAVTTHCTSWSVTWLWRRSRCTRQDLGYLQRREPRKGGARNGEELRSYSPKETVWMGSLRAYLHHDHRHRKTSKQSCFVVNAAAWLWSSYAEHSAAFRLYGIERFLALSPVSYVASAGVNSR